ncbi:molecular chaperone [Acinetobacter rudis]|uniref:Molecular chaperone n=2 Tax=Acinetobacter rudis TaxID=632955 RepID=A0AAW8JAG7_9GAMM|nr:molecular chaperone [Acinetobacter rudis]
MGLTFFFTMTQGVYAGFGLETTRVIFSEKDRNQSVVAFNTDKNISYLAQSWIQNEQGKISPDFIATPPLLKLRPQQKNTIQLTKNVVLPADKESLYWLNVKFVAPISNAENDNVLKYSMTHKIKLIYRPTLLSKIPFDQEVKKLTSEIQNNQVTLNNPTAFYINIAEIKVNGKEVKSPSFVAPYSKKTIDLGFAAQVQSKTEITYIDDYGKSILLQP